MITVKLVVLQQLQTRASEPPKAFPRYNNYQVTYKVTLIEKVPLPSRYYPQSMVKKKCSQRRFSQPPSVSGTNPATRTVGGACRKVISFSSHWRHTGGDRAGERQTNGREGELCGCRQNEREREREIEGQTERNASIDPYYLFRGGYVLATVYLSVCLSAS